MAINGKSLAAIAVTLIVVVPIGLGFLFSMNETERTGWESSDSVNLTDMMLNSELPYYNTMTGPLNNGQILFKERVPGSGGESSVLRSPDYVSVGSTVTSIPVSESMTGTLSMPSAERIITSGHTAQIPPFGNVSVVTMGDEIPLSRTALWFGSASAMTLRVDGMQLSTGQTWLGPFIYDNTTNIYSGPDNIRFFNSSDGGAEIILQPGQQMAIYVGVDVDAPAVGNHVIEGGNLAVSVWYGNNQYLRIVTIPQNGTGALLGSTYMVDGEVIRDDVSKIKYCSIGTVAASNYSYTYTRTGASFANPALGWAVPYSEHPHSTVWSNAQQNREIVMYAHVEEGETFTMRALCGGHDMGREFTVGNDRGMAYISMNAVRQDLGHYTDLQLKINTDGVTLSGITGWPVMGSEPVIYNTVTAEDSLPGEIIQLSIKSNTDLNPMDRRITFRVDSAEAVAGTFASTKDYTLDMPAVWPGVSYSVKPISIGVYGDAITFGGTPLPVTDNAVTVGLETIDLVGAVFSSVKEEGAAKYTNAINGNEVSMTDEPATITWGGDWSVIVTGYKMQQVTGTVTEWTPGEFGLDDTGFITAGLITAAICAIGLGLVGPRSGTKMAAILFVCGAASIILLVMM